MNRHRTSFHRVYPGSRLFRYGLMAVPLLSLFVVVFAPGLSLGDSVSVVLRPFFGLVVVYYWTIYRPDLTPLLGVFAIGILYDLGSGGIVGLSPLLFVTLRGLVGIFSQQFRLQGFVVNWGFWLLMTILALSIESVVNGMILSRQVSLWTMIVNLVASWLLFPVFFVLFEWFRVRFLGDAEGG